jgi:hypothetical protein
MTRCSGPPRTRLVAALLIGTLALIIPASSAFAGSLSAACSTEVPLRLGASATYDSPYGRFIDGMIYNDTTRTVVCPWVRVTWPDGRQDIAWPETGRLAASGGWTTFHFAWPAAVPVTAVPVLEPFSEPGTDPRVALSVGTPSGPVRDTATGKRTWEVVVTNGSGVAVSGIELFGSEFLYGSFHDALFEACGPDSLDPGASATYTLYGKNPTPGAVNVAYLAAFGCEQPTVTLTAGATSPASGEPVWFRMELRDSVGSLLTGGRTLKLYSSADGVDWYKDQYVWTDTGVAYVALVPGGPTYYRATFWGDGEYGSAHSAPVYVLPVGGPPAPVAPATVKSRRFFTLTGVMRAETPAAGPTVTVRCYRKVGRRWIQKATFAASADQYGEYAKRVVLKQRGYWRIRAYRPGIGYSAYRYLRVK